MERLSDIMKTAQGPYMAAHQRFPQSPEQRSQRQPGPARRPLADQEHRQPRPTRPAPARSPFQAAPRVPEAREEQWEEPVLPPTRTSRANYGSTRIPRTPPPSRYAEKPPLGDYYAEEERTYGFPADAQEEWSDDTAGMRYGDWESAPGMDEYPEEKPSGQPAPYPREADPLPRPYARETMQAAQRLAQIHSGSGPRLTRELSGGAPENPPLAPQSVPPRALSEDMRSARTREMREVRLPMPVPGAQLTPGKSPQRITQPLRSQRIARLKPEQSPQQALRLAQANTPATLHEVGADYTITVSTTQGVCPICKGAGFLRHNVSFGDPQFGKAVACRCKEQERKRKRRQQLQELSNLGAFATKRFDTFNPRVPGLQEAFRVSEAFASSPEGWLLLVGPNGCGKTHLAAAIANECLEAGAVVLFATVPDLLDHLRAAFAPTASEVYDQLFARMREAEVLVLDDLGVQQSSPWANEKLFQLLNYRYNSGFPTVITANLRGLQATDERIRSRLSDISLVRPVNLDHARDYRPNNPQRNASFS